MHIVMAIMASQRNMVTNIGILAVLVQIAIIQANIAILPTHTTVKVGQSASFILSTSVQTDYVFWKKLSTKELIYNGQVGQSSIADRNKHTVNQTGLNYNLTILATDRSNGGIYIFNTQAQVDEAASLVVVATPSVTINQTTSLVVGSPVNITCSVDYGGTTTNSDSYPLSPEQDLKLSIAIGAKNPTIFYPDSAGVVAYDFKTNTDPAVRLRRKFLSVVKTLASNDAGYVTCSVSSTKPYYQDSTQTIMPLNAPTTSVTITVVNGSSSLAGNKNVGDVINCTADGYPVPTVEWSTTNAQCKNTEKTKGSGWASFKVSCPGSNNWNCTASNNVGKASQMISFTVTGGGSSADTSQGFAFRPNGLHYFITILVSLGYFYKGRL